MKLAMELLWKLQTCETSARALADEIKRMPEALEKARGEMAVREGELKARETELQDLVKRRRGLEKDVEALDQKIRETFTRQTAAKTNAEFDALKKEAAYLKDQKSELETKILELFDAEEAHQPRIAAARATLARAQAQVAERQREIEQRMAGEQAELERRQAECRSLAGDLPADLRQRFEHVSRAKAGLAVVPVQRGACGGCFNSLPPQFVNEVRKAERLVVCEGCGRILVWLETAESEGA